MGQDFWELPSPTPNRFQVPWLKSVPIAVSNNIDEEELARLAQEVGQGRGCAGGWGALGLQMLAELRAPPLLSSRAVR